MNPEDVDQLLAFLTGLCAGWFIMMLLLTMLRVA